MAPSGSAKNKRGAKAGAAVAAAGNGNANAAADASTSTPAANAASDFAGLVPSSADEFRSLEFWDGFFKARGDAAFEWYGDWRTLKPILLPLCLPKGDGGGGGGGGGAGAKPAPPPPPPPPPPKILMLGCGNSELSAQMYDAGCEAITNVDFCPGVIREMMGKNLRRRPRMQWLVADITALPRGSRRFPDRGFDVVVDKGGLDALHSDDGDEEGGGGGGGGGDGVSSVDFARGGAAAAVGLAASVRRVLAPGGRYACVSLCQRAVLSGLLASYRLRGGWEVSIEAPPPPPDMASSPLQPLCVVVRRPEAEEAEEEEEEAEGKGGDGKNARSYSPVVCRVPRPRLDAPNAEQLADVFSVVAAENVARERGERSAWVEAAAASSSSSSSTAAAAAAEPPATPAKPSSSSSSSRPPSSATPSSAPAHAHAPAPAPSAPPPAVSFDELCPGREVQVLLPQESQQRAAAAAAAGGNNDRKEKERGGGQQRHGRHRYVATVVDRELPPRTNNRAPSRVLPPPAPTCSVFIVPQGREHEWLFSTGEGRATVAAQVGAGRCVFVAAAAGAPFPAAWDAAALQRDLDPLVLPLTPAALRGIPKAVPFVTLGEGLGKAPKRVCEVESSAVPGTGALLVQDVEVSPDDDSEGEDDEGKKESGDDVVVVGARRLVFGGARSLIQSEVPLVVPRKSWRQAKEGEKGGKEQERPFPALSTHLPSAYHCAILAGLAALGERGGGGASGRGNGKEAARGEEEEALGRKSVLVVGLGAGGLAAHLAAERRCSVTAVELDPRVVELARDHFGLASVEEALLLRRAEGEEGKKGGGEGRGSLAVVVGDGVVEVEKAAGAAASNDSSRSSLSAIVVDAGGGDASLAMSCPPQPFVTDAFAASAAAALLHRPEGRGGGGDGGGEGGGGGVLAVNCVSRDQRPVAALVETLKRHFSRVFEIDVPEDVNRVLFATGPKEKGGAAAAAAEEEGGGAAGGRARSGSSAASKQGRSKLPSLPRGDEAVSKALDAYFGACSGASVRDPGDAAGGSSVAEMADLLVER